MKKHGFIDLEFAMTFFFLIMLIATIYSVHRVWHFDTPNPESPNKWLDVCQNTLELMNGDIKYASAVRVSSETLQLDLPDGRIVSYAIASGSLKREEAGGNTRLLMANLNTGYFYADSRLPGLISALFIPVDQMNFPFFTSFAVRGQKP